MGVKEEDTNDEGIEKLQTIKIESLFSEITWTQLSLFHTIKKYYKLSSPVSFCKMSREHKRTGICLVPIFFCPAVLHGLFTPCPAPLFGLFFSLDNEASGGKSTISAVRRKNRSVIGWHPKKYTFRLNGHFLLEKLGSVISRGSGQL